MTLKEKFKKIEIKLSENHTTKIVDREADIMVKIADEFAIEFAEWVLLRHYYILSRKIITSKELLEIFKKEKGL